MRVDRHSGGMLDVTGSIGNDRFGFTTLPLILLYSMSLFHSNIICFFNTHIRRVLRHDELKLDEEEFRRLDVIYYTSPESGLTWVNFQE